MHMLTRAAFLASCLGGAALAQHSGDVLLTIQGGRIQTGAVLPNGQLDTDERVFVAELGTTFANFTDSPGFDCLPGTFAAGTRIGFRFTAALHEWDGSAFSSIPDEVLAASFGPLGPIETPPADQTVTGFMISVGANGQWHRHLEYELLDPAEDGLYLAEMTLFSNSPSYAESKPFWIIFDQNASAAELNEATAWVVVNKLCPADFNGDGFADGFDYDDFVQCFEGGPCPQGKSADFNNDTFADGFDYDDFVIAFESGC